MYTNEIDKYFCRHCNEPVMDGTQLHGCEKMQLDLAEYFENISNELTWEADIRRKANLRNLNADNTNKKS